GATIRYTTNGSEPTESSSAVTSGGKVSVPVPGTLKARAWKTGMNPSDTKTANYTASPVLSVSPGSREVSWDAESTNFSVSNTGGGTMNWTASVTDGAGWLSIQSGSSGTNSGTINLSFSQNTGASPRTGTITVTALGASGSPKAVTVRQNGNNSSDGYLVTSELWIKAVFKPTWMPHFDLRWQKCGDDVSATGDRTVWGYMYADPVDFPYGNVTNPEIFIKIYKAANGWQNIAFNHVTVDDVDVFSALNYTGIPNQSDTLTLYNRLVDHTYYLAEMKSAMYLDGDKFCEKDIPSIIRGSHLTGTLSLKEVLTAYMNRAGSGHMTHAGISEYLDAILDSNEVKEMIEWFYAVLLGKRPDALEVETWKNYLRSGLSLNVDARYVVLEMGRMFFESREYREGSRPDTRCIEDAFMVFLKRMPQGMEMSQLLSQLWLCEELMTMFARSTEFADRLYGIFMGSCGTPAGNLVAGIYSGLLNRLVYSDEMHRLSGLLEETGITKEAIAGIIIEILDTVEFTSGSPEHSDLIVRLYSTIHGHFPDSEKVFELAGQLESGIITPAVLVMSLIGSEDSLSASTGGAQGQP
ncbi:MAG: chitobiase/beta-hexosaminidase C-terminal domain-containing protein, partial [Deltaproteobacteria bacterium]|nr:chitobiase/beta-hexosaminidase C-terminal domain-containing protein [Deltaproteobacteria bacterium]